MATLLVTTVQLLIKMEISQSHGCNSLHVSMYTWLKQPAEVQAEQMSC